MKLPPDSNHFSSSPLRWITFAILFLAFTACQQEDSRDTAALPSDEEIATTVQVQLENARDVPAEDIDVSTQNGVVTLAGSTDHLLAKRRATEIAESVYGVLSIVNNIKVTADRPDEDIGRDINQAIRQNPATENWKISTTVNNGLVSLKGTVNSWQERQIVETIAQGVRGVRNIENNITVSYDETRGDQEIRQEIEQTLRMDARINGDRVKVNVEEGRVTLSGSVGSARERTLAVEQAHVAGVDSVSADNLEVLPEYRDELLRSAQMDTLTSDEIKNAIEDALAYDPRVPSDEIDVSVDNSTVTLSGSVENLNSKIAAEEDVLNTAGVNTVENNIEVTHKVVVRSGVPTSDEATKSRIREAIVRNPYVGQTPADIDVTVTEGIVELTGDVDSEFEKNQIEKVASNVKGVIAVNNNLNVSDDAQS